MAKTSRALTLQVAPGVERNSIIMAPKTGRCDPGHRRGTDAAQTWPAGAAIEFLRSALFL